LKRKKKEEKKERRRSKTNGGHEGGAGISFDDFSSGERGMQTILDVF
jgi:hypothetical protein